MESDNALEEWGMGGAEATTTLAELDEIIVKYRAARDLKDALNEKVKEAQQEIDRIEALMINTLQANKRTKYEVEGVAGVSIVHRESFTTPKSPEAKTTLFNYIKEKHGDQALLGLLSINSQTLNSWAKQESESGVMSIPGLEAPTSTETISMRRKG